MGGAGCAEFPCFSDSRVGGSGGIRREAGVDVIVGDIGVRVGPCGIRVPVTRVGIFDRRLLRASQASRACRSCVCSGRLGSGRLVLRGSRSCGAHRPALVRSRVRVRVRARARDASSSVCWRLAPSRPCSSRPSSSLATPSSSPSGFLLVFLWVPPRLPPLASSSSSSGGFLGDLIGRSPRRSPPAVSSARRLSWGGRRVMAAGDDG